LERTGRRATPAFDKRKSMYAGGVPTWPSRYVCSAYECADIVTGRDLRLRDRIARQAGDHLLVQDHQRWFAIDTRNWQRRELKGATAEHGDVIDGFVGLGRRVYDIELARLVGEVNGLMDDGSATRGYGHDLRRRVLRGASDPARTGLGTGPLHWEIR
jgi:hypothetical protein